ncbi:MAG TPA: NUDIX hydrolase [Anaerolineales bacterium]|jgi:ADP-ribose pyrophosphatase|nr:NUDIX hydrolase [Anaerolineales bacterium]
MTNEILSSETVFRGRAFKIQQDRVQRPNGPQTYDTVHHIGAVAMVPVDSDGRILFVSQYRHAARHRLLELPAGTLEEDEPVEETAQRELREEVGMAPGRLTKLADFFLAPGYSTERMHIYLAEDLRPDSLAGDEDEELETKRLTLDEAFAAIHSGEIEDAKTMLGLFLFKEYLTKKELGSA